jgi:translation elongation factor EF-1beta
MKNSRLGKVLSALLVATLVALAPVSAQQDVSEEDLYRLVNQIQKKILTLNNFGVFDYISFGLKGGQTGIIVVLQGYASRPTLKDSAEKSVSQIEEVESVENNIEVLPVGQNDENIRLAVYRAIYFDSVLSRYNPNRGTPMYGPGGMGGSWSSGGAGAGLWARNDAFGISNDPPMGYHPIAIIVKGGNVSMEGVIDNQGHKDMANLKARGVSGVFSVTNNLEVLNPQEKK